MKKNIAIVAFLIICLIFAFAFVSRSQTIVYPCGNGEGCASKVISRDKYPSVVNSDTVLLADETILNYTKTEAKITCDNEKVFNDIFTTHGLLFKRFTCTWKTDRHGRYKHYVVYLSKEDAELIKSWANKNL